MSHATLSRYIQMQPTLSDEKLAEREAIARATAEFLSGGGKIERLGNSLRPIKNMTWRDEGDATWQAKVRGDLPPKAPAKPRPAKRPAKITPQETVDRLNKARSAKGKAARDALAPAIRELAALGVIRANIARAVDISPATVDRIGKEHGIAIPLQPRKGTRQARRNAELREEWQ